VVPGGSVVIHIGILCDPVGSDRLQASDRRKTFRKTGKGAKNLGKREGGFREIHPYSLKTIMGAGITRRIIALVESFGG
jgi:hypothetical protein